MLKKILNARIDLMRELYEVSSPITHNNEKGGFREFFVSELIEPLLPHNYGIGSGIIIDSSGIQSTQMDIIIYDKSIMQPILNTGSSGIFPVESVLAIVEIKSEISTTEYRNLIPALGKLLPLNDSNDGSNSLKIAVPGSLPEGGTAYPFYAIFAYTTNAENKTEFDRIKESIIQEDLIRRIQLVCVMDKELLKNQAANGPELKFEFLQPNRYASPNDMVIDFLKELLRTLNQISVTRGRNAIDAYL